MQVSLPVNTADIDEHVYEFRADFIVFHLYWVTICSDVDLTDHVEQEGFLDLGVADQIVYHSWDELYLGE